MYDLFVCDTSRYSSALSVGFMLALLVVCYLYYIKDFVVLPPLITFL